MTNDGEVIIVDEHTGRLKIGNRYGEAFTEGDRSERRRARSAREHDAELSLQISSACIRSSVVWYTALRGKRVPADL